MLLFRSLIRCSAYMRLRYLHTSQKYLAPIMLRMPALSPTMTDGGIVEWHKKEGEEVTAGDMLCEIQTDKAVVGFEADEDGVLAKIIHPANSQGVKVGKLIAVLAEPDEDWQSVEIPAESAPAPESSPPQPPTSPPTPASAASSGGAPVEGVGPAVRLLMETYHIDPTVVAPSGPHGNIIKEDVQKYISAHSLKPVAHQVEPPSSTTLKTPGSPPSKTTLPKSQPGSPAGYVDIPMSNMRKTIAKRLSQSKATVPHSYTSASCRVDALMDSRTLLKQRGIKVSLNDYVIKACALALRVVPEVNASLSASGHVQYNPNVDVSVAVATDTGLITPIVAGADTLGLVEIGERVGALAAKAREGKLQPHEFMGGTFTISNLGMFGVNHFTAIINAPQSCILAVGSAQPVLQPSGTFASLLTLTLSWDARHLDDVYAARFLAQVRAGLENPGVLEMGLTRGAGASHRRDPFEDVLGLGLD